MGRRYLYKYAGAGNLVGRAIKFGRSALGRAGKFTRNLVNETERKGLKKFLFGGGMNSAERGKAIGDTLKGTAITGGVGLAAIPVVESVSKSKNIRPW